MAAASKTGPTDADVSAWIAALEPAMRRADAETLCAMLARLSGEPPVLWGPSIIGFGDYHYRYDSGRSGTAPRIGFSPRKAAHVLYGLHDDAELLALLARLGKHSTGSACLYIRRLADIDMTVLESLVVRSLAVMAERHPIAAAG